jgi:hypothetical protein
LNFSILVLKGVKYSISDFVTDTIVEKVGLSEEFIGEVTGPHEAKVRICALVFEVEMLIGAVRCLETSSRE